MLDIFNKWYRRYLFEEESVLLLVLLSIAIVLLMTIGDILAPMLAALVLAFLMEGIASRLERLGLPQLLGVSVAYVVFVGAFFCRHPGSAAAGVAPAGKSGRRNAAHAGGGAAAVGRVAGSLS